MIDLNKGLFETIWIVMTNGIPYIILIFRPVSLVIIMILYIKLLRMHKIYSIPMRLMKKANLSFLVMSAMAFFVFHFLTIKISGTETVSYVFFRDLALIIFIVTLLQMGLLKLLRQIYYKNRDKENGEQTE